MGGLQAVTRPIGHFFVRVGTWLLAGDRESGEQLASFVDEFADQETIEDDEREYIRSLFGFGGTIIRELMVPRTDMVTVGRDSTIGEARDVFLKRGVSRVPVIGDDADEVLGILHLRDTVGVEAERGVLGRARPSVFVPESQKAADLLKQMQLERFHMAMAVDEYGGIAGLVTMEDLIEELVGDISDESDRELPDVVDLGEGRYRVAARLNVEDLGELFDSELVDDDVDSVGGLLAKALGELPRAGASAVVGSVRLTVDRMERRRVRTVIAEPAAALDPEPAA